MQQEERQALLKNLSFHCCMPSPIVCLAHSQCSKLLLKIRRETTKENINLQNAEYIYSLCIKVKESYPEYAITELELSWWSSSAGNSHQTQPYQSTTILNCMAVRSEPRRERAAALWPPGNAVSKQIMNRHEALGKLSYSKTSCSLHQRQHFLLATLPSRNSSVCAKDQCLDRTFTWTIFTWSCDPRHYTLPGYLKEIQ